MNVAIVVAAGKGNRLGGDRPKQFLELAGIPILIHTLRRFEESNTISQVVVVVPAGETDAVLWATREFGLNKPAKAVVGGETRAQSVLCGLRAIDEADIIAVHDAVRPLVTAAEIDKVVQAASEKGAAVLVAPLTDTIKRVENCRIAGTLPRAGLRRALTPQCFRHQIIRRAYERIEEVRDEITDDCMLVEQLGIEVFAVDGSARNIKITRPEDVAVAEALMKQMPF